MFNRKNKLKKYSTAQLVEELSSRAGVDIFIADRPYGVLAHSKNVKKSYPTSTKILFVTEQDKLPV